MNKLSYLAAILTAVVASSASAQYVGPSSAQPVRSVLEVTKNPVDDTEVILRGFLIKKLGDENYLFSDGTGEIRVEIDSEDFPRENVTDVLPLGNRCDLQAPHGSLHSVRLVRTDSYELESREPRYLNT